MRVAIVQLQCQPDACSIILRGPDDWTDPDQLLSLLLVCWSCCAAVAAAAAAAASAADLLLLVLLLLLLLLPLPLLKVLPLQISLVWWMCWGE